MLITIYSTVPRIFAMFPLLTCHSKDPFHFSQMTEWVLKLTKPKQPLPNTCIPGKLPIPQRFGES